MVSRSMFVLIGALSGGAVPKLGLQVQTPAPIFRNLRRRPQNLLKTSDMPDPAAVKPFPPFPPGAPPPASLIPPPHSQTSLCRPSRSRQPAIGFFGAFLNISSGVALAGWSDAGNRGLYSGIFNAFNQGSAIPGNVLAIVLLCVQRGMNHASASPPAPMFAALLRMTWTTHTKPEFLRTRHVE